MLDLEIRDTWKHEVLLFLIILIFCRIETQVAVDLFYCYFIRFLNYTSNVVLPSWLSDKESACNVETQVRSLD